MKTILVTGATSGIGEAVTAQLVARGDHVIACGRNWAALNALKIKHGERLDIQQFDVSDRQAVKSALSGIPLIDVAILNAGTCEYVDTDLFDSALFERVMAANFLGLVYCTEYLLPKLKAGSGLVYMDSLARLLPFTQSQAYGASKAAAHYFARCMEVDLAPQGIFVLTISPGFVETPLTRKNDFAMPMQIPAEEAANLILTGIDHQKRNILAPRLFGWILLLLGSMPESAQVWLSKKLKGAR